jgi:hypothetical protein
MRGYGASTVASITEDRNQRESIKDRATKRDLSRAFSDANR